MYTFVSLSELLWKHTNKLNIAYWVYMCVYACILIYVCFLFTSAHCHYPARGELVGQSHVNQSVASWRHRSVPLSPSQGEGGRSELQNLSDYFSSFLFFLFFLMQPGKQLSAIQITCQSDCDEGSFRSLDQSACLLTPSAAQCLFPSPSPSPSFFSPPVCLMPADALESVLKSKGSAREMKCHVFGSV